MVSGCVGGMIVGGGRRGGVDAGRKLNGSPQSQDALLPRSCDFFYPWNKLLYCLTFSLFDLICFMHCSITGGFLCGNVECNELVLDVHREGKGKEKRRKESLAKGRLKKMTVLTRASPSLSPSPHSCIIIISRTLLCLASTHVVIPSSFR